MPRQFVKPFVKSNSPTVQRERLPRCRSRGPQEQASWNSRRSEVDSLPCEAPMHFECAAEADADALLAPFGGLEIHLEDPKADDSRCLSWRLGLRRGWR